MTRKFSIDNRELIQRISSGEAVVGIDFGNLIVRELAAFRLAAMDSEPVELPPDYLHGHKDGLEWAAKLAEANHPETGDWLYDDPIELAKAIRKGPDMPPVQPVADSEPVIVVGDDGGDALSYRRLIQSFEPGTKLYRHAQPAPELKPVGYLFVSDQGAITYSPTDWGIPGFRLAGQIFGDIDVELKPAPVVPEEVLKSLDLLFHRSYFRRWVKDPQGYVSGSIPVRDLVNVVLFADTCRAAMLAAVPQSPGSEPDTVPGKWIPVSERMPENDVPVLTFDGMYKRVHHAMYGHWQCWEPEKITHWMPLPAAPQEVKP